MGLLQQSSRGVREKRNPAGTNIAVSPAEEKSENDL